MSFASPEYLPFLALVALVLPFLAGRWRMAGMLAASYAFFALRAPVHLAVLLLSTGIDFAAGIGMDRAGGRPHRARRAWLALSVAGNLGLLFAFKYLPNAARSLGLPFPELALPIGLSFYTFQSLGYSIDVYRGRIAACRDPLLFALFVSFFPQVIAGPIERARRLLPQLVEMQPVGLASLSQGSRLILWGLAKKLCAADRLRPVVLERLHDASGLDALTCATTFVGAGVLLYLDFSAYTDIARGSGRLFGVRLSENFRQPFLATSVADCMRRWHVTLIEWITDYVWGPLMRGGRGVAGMFACNITVLSLLGLWHGPELRFLAFGVIGGAAITVGQLRRQRRVERGERPRPPGPARRFAGWLFTVSVLSVVASAIVARESGAVLRLSQALLRLDAPSPDALREAGMAAVCAAAALAIHAYGGRRDRDRDWLRVPAVLRPVLLAGFALAVARFQVQGAEFVYFRF